jgi:hypothetical protein
MADTSSRQIGQIGAASIPITAKPMTMQIGGSACVIRNLGDHSAPPQPTDP